MAAVPVRPPRSTRPLARSLLGASTGGWSARATTGTVVVRVHALFFYSRARNSYTQGSVVMKFRTMA